MSFGLVPLPDKLLMDKRVTAERKLGVSATLPVKTPPPKGDLYLWADEILELLRTSGRPSPKLELAESLDIHVDACWRGSVATRFHAPRHRVMARFAREGLWKEVWSFNWDCTLESAFESVGLKRGTGTDDKGMPWLNVFTSFTTATDCCAMGQPRVIKVVKPHGCAIKIIEAREAMKAGNATRAAELADRFLITATELDNLKPAPGADGTQHFIFAHLRSNLGTQPLIVAGWSVSESYLIKDFEDYVQPVLAGRALEEDELSVIDIAFQPGHIRLAVIYGKAEPHVFLKVFPAPAFSTDALWLWLQALYGVGCLKTWTPDPDKAEVDALLTELEQPPDAPHFAIPWVDAFLPSWVRLCWRCDLRPVFKNGARVPVEDLPLEEIDAHIPWILQNDHDERPDLKAAARILAALRRTGSGGRWDYAKYRGGFLQSNHLVIPLPAWLKPPSSLRGFKHLIDDIKAGGIFFDKVSILPIGLDGTTVVDPATVSSLKAFVARELAMIPFTASSIGDLRLEDL